MNISLKINNLNLLINLSYDSAEYKAYSNFVSLNKAAAYIILALGSITFAQKTPVSEYVKSELENQHSMLIKQILTAKKECTKYFTDELIDDLIIQNYNKTMAPNL
jgi:hypothetical protein